MIYISQAFLFAGYPVELRRESEIIPGIGILLRGIKGVNI